jgi:hypothetical protein
MPGISGSGIEENADDREVELCSSSAKRGEGSERLV